MLYVVSKLSMTDFVVVETHWVIVVWYRYQIRVVQLIPSMTNIAIIHVPMRTGPRNVYSVLSVISENVVVARIATDHEGLSLEWE